MSNYLKKPPFPFMAFLFSIIGVGFCIANGLGKTEALCITQGCSLYKDLKLYGFSMWWWGCAGFGILALLSLLRWIELLYFTVVVGVLIDCLLLIWMALTAPCLNCMIAGLLFLLVLLGTRALVRDIAPLANPRGSLGALVAILWLVTLSPNIFAAANEAVGPWIIYGDRDRPVRLFFSPSCPACKEAVRSSMRNGSLNVALIPVSEKESDIAKIACLENSLEAGDGLVWAFEECLGATSMPEMELLDYLLLQANLLRNKAALARYGADRIPLIITSGMPRVGDGSQPADLSGLGADDYGGCSEEDEDCD